MWRAVKLISIILFAFLLIVGCSPRETEPRYETPIADADSITPSPTVTATVSPTPTDTPTPTPTHTPTPTPGPLSSQEIFAKLSPSVVFIETATTRGSGVLIEGGYILTNAHVLWPYSEARVVFPDGTDIPWAKVVNMDMMADLAVIGPVQVAVEPLSFADGEQLATGSDVYVIGYPGEVEKSPQPTVSRGVISRLREWETGEITYFQIDAQVSPGASGGLLASERGEFIGITNFRLNSGYGLAVSAGDIAEHVRGLVEGRNIDDLGDREISLAGGKYHHEYVPLDDEWHVQSFVVNARAGTGVSVEVHSGTGDIAIYLMDSAGNTIDWADDYWDADEKITYISEQDGLYFLNVYQNGTESITFSITSSSRLKLLADRDDGRALLAETVLSGATDFPNDLDYFKLSLKEGQLVNIMVDSVMIDPYVVVDLEGPCGSATIEDDDSGQGLFGTNAELSFVAPVSGIYRVMVYDSLDNVGGYAVHVRDWKRGSSEASRFPSMACSQCESHPIADYQFPESGATVKLPAGWRDASFGDSLLFCSFGYTLCIGDGNGVTLVVLEEDLSMLGIEDLEGYMKLLREILSSMGEITAERAFTTDSGLQAKVLEFDAAGYTAMRFVAVADDWALSLTFIGSAESIEAYRSLLEKCIFNSVSG